MTPAMPRSTWISACQPTRSTSPRRFGSSMSAFEGDPEGVPFDPDPGLLRQVATMTLISEHGPLDLCFVPTGFPEGHAGLSAHASTIEVATIFRWRPWRTSWHRSRRRVVPRTSSPCHRSRPTSVAVCNDLGTTEPARFRGKSARGPGCDTPQLHHPESPVVPRDSVVSGLERDALEFEKGAGDRARAAPRASAAYRSWPSNRCPHTECVVRVEAARPAASRAGHHGGTCR